MKTELERTAYCIVRLYHQYAILNPQDDYLQLKEFQKMMKEQMPDFLRGTKPSNLTVDAYIKEIFDKADKDKSGFLTFKEFLTVFQCVLQFTHERSHHLGAQEHGRVHHLHAHGLEF